MTYMVSAALAFSPASTPRAEAPARAVEPDEGGGVPMQGVVTPTAPPRLRPFERKWPLHPTTVRLARVHARTWLAMSRWPGDQDEALLIVHEVVENGVKHPAHAPADGMVQLALSATEDGELEIKVTDPDPRFPLFNEVITAGTLTGLGRVRALGGEVTWGTPDAEHGKTVRVRVRPSTP